MFIKEIVDTGEFKSIPIVDGIMEGKSIVVRTTDKIPKKVTVNLTGVLSYFDDDRGSLPAEWKNFDYTIEVGEITYAYSNDKQGYVEQ